MTTALAIIGAVSGAFGTALALFTFFRDRPRLFVTYGLQVSVEHGRRVRINLTNRGRQALSVVDCWPDDGAAKEAVPAPSASAPWLDRRLSAGDELGRSRASRSRRGTRGSIPDDDEEAPPERMGTNGH